MKSSTAKDVIILALDTEEVHKPCSYRVHSESPVLIQVYFTLEQSIIYF